MDAVFSDMPGHVDGRTAAVLAVADALTGRRFAHDALAEWRAARDLDSREASLATEVSQGTLRRLVTIEHVLAALAQIDRRRTSDRLRAILNTAVYQVIWLDRIPVFAAVDEAVELARRLAGGAAPRMVNAVLRRVTRAVAERRVPWRRLDPTQVRVNWDQACRFNVAVLPEVPSSGVAGTAEPEAVGIAAHLAAATGERLPRYVDLVARFGAEAAEAAAWASSATPAVVLQADALRLSPADFERRLREQFGEAVSFSGGAAFLPAAGPAVDSLALREGLVFVQDSTAHAAARAVGARPGERVLDLCAAPGGKSLVLALDMEDRGEVVACDTAPERLARVRANAERLGLTCVRTQLLDPSATGAEASAAAGSSVLAATSSSESSACGPRWDGTFDAALVDVPCSNTGVIARRPEARLGLTARKLESLVTLQGQLLRQAAGFVRPGGRLVYSTCSIEPAENEQIVAGFLSENRGWRLDVQETTLPTWGPRPAGWRDGGYFARLMNAT